MNRALDRSFGVVALLGAAALFACAALPAAGAEPSPLERAIELYWDGLFDEAVKALELLAATLEGDERIVAGEYLARSFVRLGEEERGKAVFKELLRSRPDWKPDPKEAAGPEMAAFEAALAEYENENLGGVSVRSEPTRANVYLDGDLRREPTPVTIERIPAGEHVIRVERDGFAPIDTLVTIDAGEIAALDLVLVETVKPEGRVPFWKKRWVQLAAGGVFGAGLILALSGGGGGDAGEAPADLPGFPEPPHD
jgi:hypothetical protein